MKYIHPIASHSSVPFTPKCWIKSIKGRFEFTSKSIYNFDNIDQFDWNKLCGISWNPFQPNQNALMLGWRYRPDIKKFEVCPYINYNGRNIPYELPEQILTFEIRDLGEFFIDKEEISFRNCEQKGKVSIKVPPGVSGHWLTSFRVQPWFGGNNVAPNQVELNLSFL